jgi:23S rRNA (pseudouridine1915-N3)-methyltransferase
MELIEVEAGKAIEKGSEVERLKHAQAQVVLSQVKEGECLVVLDEDGKSFTSVQFADWLHKSMVGGVSQIVFAIGGAYGWADDVRKRADMVLSLSQLTFPHQLCRLILIEQLYRVFSILDGSPYHKV